MKRLLLSTAFALILTTQAQADIKIAMAGPLTGSSATFGEQMRLGAEQAVADINAAGGVLGQKLALSLADDACDPKQAVAAAQRLATDGVVFVAGHFCSGSSIPASRVYADENIIQISPASTNPLFTEQGLDTVFRVCGRDDQQGAVAGAYIAEHFKGKNIAILNDKSAYGVGLAEQVQKTLKSAGTAIVIYDAYNAGERDYSAIVARLKQANIDVLFVGGYHTETGLIARQLRDQGMQTQIIGGDGLVTSEYWGVTGPAGEGTLMTFGPDPRNMPQAKAIVDAFRKKKIEPEGYNLYTYAAIQAWVDAVRAANSTDATKVKAALKTGTFKTVLGDIAFDAKGDVKAPMFVIYRWNSGKFGEVK